MIPLPQFARLHPEVSEERIRQLCKQHRIPGANKVGEGPRGVWMIPENATLPLRANGRPERVDANDYPQLLTVMWDRADKVIDGRDALALYERNRKWIEPENMDVKERSFFNRLVAKYGNGVFNG